MEKLIQLLNEHELEEAKEIWIIVYKWEAHWWILFAIPTRPMNISALSILETRAVLVNKEYWFIKRLVENKKIDFDNRDLKDEFMLEFERYPVFQGNTYNRDFNENGLLMLLSIQDNPIEFLISVLK